MSKEYTWNPGAPASEHLTEDQLLIELEKAHDRIRFLESSEEGEIIGLRNLTEQYKEQIVDYEETVGQLKAENDRLRKELELQHNGILEVRKNLLDSLRLEIFTNERCCK